MSNTRHQLADGPFRQERFASSQEFERGLGANLVAKRCVVLERAEDRELVWFLQLLSHQDGGLKRLAAELCARFPNRIATPTMQRLGAKPGQVYNAKQVAQVRAEIPDGCSDYPLRGEIDDLVYLAAPNGPRDAVDQYTGEWETERDAYLDRAKAEAAQLPASYEASKFVSRCAAAAVANLERHLGELCLDPATALVDGSPWYFPNLIATLREYQSEWVEQRRESFVVTAIGQKVYDALDYARETRCMVLIDGDSRIGKTEAVKSWIAQNPGAARYVEVPSTNDELGFFRAVAKGLGMSCGGSWKAVQLRSRIEEVLQTGQLTIVFDEAHYALPTSSCRTTIPGRINWIMTALINKGVPVAMVTTPQFMKRQKEVEQRTGWTSEQFTGRIGHYEKLPQSLSLEDLRKVAKALLPLGDERSIESLVDYAQGSKKYLAAAKMAATRAAYLARKAGRDRVLYADV